MTEYFTIYSHLTGEALFRGSGPEGSAAIQTPPSGHSLILLPVGEWDKPLSAVPLDVLKSALWAQVRGRRDRVIDGGAATPVGVVDSDLLSRTNINGAVTAAQIAKAAGSSFSVDWTDKANVVHTLDADGMIALGLAVMAHVDAAHSRARDLRGNIEGATTAATALTIDTHSGWPG